MQNFELAISFMKSLWDSILCSSTASGPKPVLSSLVQRTETSGPANSKALVGGFWAFISYFALQCLYSQGYNVH